MKGRRMRGAPIRKSGTVIGGFTLRLNREWIKPHLQRDWDLVTGIVNFAPLDEIVSYP